LVGWLFSFVCLFACCLFVCLFLLFVCFVLFVCFDTSFQAIARLERLGGVRVPEFDFAPFAETAQVSASKCFVAF
jgi:hypothetical protein